MEQRALGNSGIKASAIGLGLMSKSGTYGKFDEAECIAVIHKALDLGVNLLDSSDMDDWGQGEELLGRALKGRRDKALVTTKFGQVKNPAGGGNLVDGRPEYVMQACDASLKRLGVEVIDLYYVHRIDPTFRTATGGGTIRASRTAISHATASWSSGSRACPARKAARSGSSCSRGCSPRARTSCRFPARSGRRGCRKTSAR